MTDKYDDMKRELRELLSLIEKSRITFEDARNKLLQGVETEKNRAESVIEERKQELELKKEKSKSEIDLYRAEIERELDVKRSEIATSLKNQDIERQVLIQLTEEKSQGFPWLAKAYKDYYRLRDDKIAAYLENKPHPVLKAAEDHRQIAKERREAEEAARLANYLLDYCRYLAPWLDDYISLDAAELDKIISDIHSAWEKKEREFDEEVKRHLGPKYEALTPIQKLQKKLDWYWEKPNKTDWQIGRDYERYIGYLYEIKGWNVYYHGKKGFEDLGRDLICKKQNSTEIIQCKRWAQEKTIHEKHIFYLFGTTVEYYLDNFPINDTLQLSLFPELIREKNVIPKLIATAPVSEKASQVAKVLGVTIETILFQDYPSVKCNVSRKTGERIYHLPFDQQYDTILVEDERLERYVKTISEAENRGFRHAFRWEGENGVKE